MKTIILARNGEIKQRLPYEEKPDGTLWAGGVNPLFGIDNDTDKAIVMALHKEKKWNEIPAKFFVKYGMNENGVLALSQEDWDKHPWGIAAAEKYRLDELARAEKEAKIARIFLSSRGWGDFSGVEWEGDITKPEAEILSECRHLLESGNDVDRREQSDDEILQKIAAEKEKRAWEIFKFEEAKTREEARELLKTTATMTTTTKMVEDEGGKTTVAYHSVTLKSGNTLTFTDRNIFDFGRVINPSFAIAEGVSGGLRNGNIWMDFASGKGWVPVRELTQEEKEAYDYVYEFGHHTRKGIRM